jgi:hypothetical protein
MTTPKVAFSSEGAGGFIAVPPEQATYSSEDYEREVIAHARKRDEDGEPGGRECLRLIMHAIDARRFDSPLFPYLADCIHQYLLGFPIEEAFNVVPPTNKGGKSENYDSTEIAALDILLRDYEHLGPERSISWMQKHIDQSIDRRRVQRVRKKYDKRYNPDADCPLMESCTRDLLLHLSGSLRKYVGQFPSNLPPAPEPKEKVDDLTFKIRRQVFRQEVDADTDLIKQAVSAVIPEGMPDDELRERISKARAFARKHPECRGEYLRNR